MYRIIRCIAVFLAAFVSGCSEYEMISYEDEAALYFQSSAITYSLFYLPADYERVTTYVTVNTMGRVKDYDRPVPLVQTNSGDEFAAVPGVHFVPLADNEVASLCIIKAGQATAQLPVVFIRDKSLSSNAYALELGFSANEHFKLGVADKQICAVTVADFAAKPDNWDTFWYRYFGPVWGKAKMRLIIDSTGYTEWETTVILAYGNYMKAKAKAALEAYNAAHPGDPLTEDDEHKTLVTFPD